MRRRAAALVVAMILGAWSGAVLGAGPAAAGGWAATLVDPLAGPVKAGQPYRVSFWVLQHGTHPYNWTDPPTIGRVGLTLTDARGATVSFAGQALAEAAHFVTTVTVPHNGQWRVTGDQGVFGDFPVGTLTVPGTLRAFGVPVAPSPADLDTYWPGPVRPPVLPVDPDRDPFSPYVAADDRAVAPAPGNVTEPEPVSAPPAGRDPRPPLLAALVGAVVLAVGLAVGGRRRRVHLVRTAGEEGT